MIETYTTGSGIPIYRIPIEVFPDFIGYAHLIVLDELHILVDVGSAMPQSHQDLQNNFATLRDTFNLDVTLDTLDLIIISHGHIDHFSGLTPLREEIKAPIAVHELDRRILTNFEERVIVVSKEVELFLERAGVDAELRERLREMYLFAKTLIKSVPNTRTLSDGDVLFDQIEVIHTPGHCPGQVCLRIDDILLSADHILSRTTPHLAPERITAYTGLGHYLAALDNIAALDGIRLTLGGHEEPITDLQGRIDDIKASHERKLGHFLELCKEPRTIADLSIGHYGRREGYDILLALEEAGAHVEYLYERGHLAITNLDEVEAQLNPVLCYRRL